MWLQRRDAGIEERRLQMSGDSAFRVMEKQQGRRNYLRDQDGTHSQILLVLFTGEISPGSRKTDVPATS